MRGIGFLTNVSEDKLRGVGFMVDPVNDKLRGIGIRIRDNFYLEIRDASTNLLVDDVEITIVGSSDDGTYFTNIYNSVQETNAAIVVQVTAPNYDTVNIIIAHGGDGFIVSQTILMSLDIVEIKCDPENKFNFIRWHSALGLLTDGTSLGVLNELDVFEALEEAVESLINCDTCTDLPNNYVKSVDHFYQPPFIVEDNIQNLINFDLDLTGIDAQVLIVDAMGVIKHSGILLNEVDCDGTPKYYIDFEFPLLTRGYNYRYAIVSNDTNTVLYTSNPFRVEPARDRNCYPLVSYRSACDNFGYPYECITDKSNQMRLDFNVIDQQPDIELKQYVEQSTGKQRNQKSTTSKVVKIETFFFDKGANDAMFAFSIQEDILLNNRAYEVKSAHALIYNKLSRKWKGEIELLDQEYSTVNLHG